MAVFVAFVIVSGDVRDSHGAICGSAWRAANRTLHFTGERTDAQREEAADDCERAGERVLPWAAVAGLVGVVAVGGSRYARRRSHAE